MSRKLDLTPSKIYVNNYDSTSSEYDSDRDPEFQPSEDGNESSSSDIANKCRPT